MSNLTILVVDDDAAIVEHVSEYLTQFHFAVLSAVCAAEALSLVKKGSPDLVLLDVVLPDTSGFELCRRLRSVDGALPIIMLTARHDLRDRLVGFEAGADDYVTKPCEPRELVARIQSVLRRSGSCRTAVPPTGALRNGPLAIDPASRETRFAGTRIALTETEFAALRLLVENVGRPVSRDEVSASLRGGPWSALDRSIDTLVCRLRRKLGDHPRRPRLIKTVRGAGYVLVPIDDSFKPEPPPRDPSRDTGRRWRNGSRLERSSSK